MEAENDKPIAGGSPARRSRKVLSVALGASLVVGATACASSDKSGGGSAGTTGAGDSRTGSFDPAAYAGVAATLNGSGSTFQANFDNAAIGVLTGALPELKVNYGGGGSGKGKTDLRNGVVDFAGTDSLVTETDEAKYKGRLLYFPTVVAPITVSYNLGSVSDVRLDGPTLARIFSARVKSWDDASIKATNPDAALPATPITVCHRSDASGTTTNFTRYLAAAGGADWTLGTGDSVDWDARTQGGAGNAGVAQCVKGKEGAIGYVDLSDAKAQGLTFASIRNAHGEFTQPTLEGASKAAGGAEVAADLTYDPIDAKGAGVYPITSPTWILVYADQADHAKGTALVGFLRFLLTDGQALAEGSGYAPLPTELASRALAQVGQIKVP